MISAMRIQVKHFLDKDSLHVGEFLTGTAVISVKKPALVQKVVVKLSCMEWTEPGIGDDYDFDFRKTRRLIVPFINHEDVGGHLYEPGEYSFPFFVKLDPESPDWRISPARHSREIEMPHVLTTFPSALKAWTCKVIWGLRIKVWATKYSQSKPSKKGPKMYRSDKQELDIWGNWNPLRDPPQQRETDRQKDAIKKHKKYVIMSGGMNAEGWLDKDFYFAGEEAKVDLRVQNLSTTDLSYVSIQMIKEVKCSCHGKKSNFKENLEKKSMDIHLKQNPYPTVNGQLVLPTTHFTLPLHCQSMKGLLINRVYEFRVTFHNNSMLTSALVLKIPVTILSPSPAHLSAQFLSSRSLKAPGATPPTGEVPSGKKSSSSSVKQEQKPAQQVQPVQQVQTAQQAPVQGFQQAPVQGFQQAPVQGFPPGYAPVYIIAQPPVQGTQGEGAAAQPVQYYIVQQPFIQPNADGSQPQQPTYFMMPQGFPQGQVILQAPPGQGQQFFVQAPQAAPQAQVQPSEQQPQFQ